MKRSAQEIQAWLVRRVSSITGLPPREIDVDEPYYRHGLDSVTMVVIFTELEAWLGRRLNENPLPEHPTIASLARFLADADDSPPGS